MQTLRTDRLVLDEPREADIVAVFEACQDAQTQRWVPLPRPYTRASAEFFVRSYCPHGAVSGQYLVRALREAEALPLVGVVEVRRDEAPGSASIGCSLAPDARGRGLMREALAALCDNALAPAPDGLGYTRLHWGHLIGNDRSRSLAESLGFDFSASERQRVAIDDEARELLIGVRTA